MSAGIWTAVADERVRSENVSLMRDHQSWLSKSPDGQKRRLYTTISMCICTHETVLLTRVWIKRSRSQSWRFRRAARHTCDTNCDLSTACSVVSTARTTVTQRDRCPYDVPAIVYGSIEEIATFLSPTQERMELVHTWPIRVDVTHAGRAQRKARRWSKWCNKADKHPTKVLH